MDGSARVDEIVNADGSNSVNLTYSAFKEYDSAFVLWLLTSISAFLPPNIVQCRSSYEI